MKFNWQSRTGDSYNFAGYIQQVHMYYLKNKKNFWKTNFIIGFCKQRALLG